MILYIVIFAFLVYGVDSNVEKYKSNINCLTLNCKSNGKVCGIRSEGEGYRIRLFPDECALLNYKCAVNENFGYEVTNMDYCSQALLREPDFEQSNHDPCAKFDCLHPSDDVPVCGLRQDGKGFRIRIFRNKCVLWTHNCVNHVNFTITAFYICNDLELPAATDKMKQLRTADMPYENNIDNEQNLKESENQDNLAKGKPSIEDANRKLDKPDAYSEILDDDFYIASDVGSSLNSNSNNDDPTPNIDKDYTNSIDFTTEPVSQINVPTEEDSKTTLGQTLTPKTMNDNIDPSNPDINQEKFKNLVVVHGVLRDLSQINETINRFFAATHVFDLPIKRMPTDYLNETTRRRLIKVAGPIKVFFPVLVVPKNVSEEPDYEPTLRSCFHKCPKKCPPTYAPVCGLPGRKAREPSLMFQNHCFMDVAQCKQYREDKSPTSLSSAYNENAFVFCLGDTMNNMYHFLPLLKTLQHMGRLPKKGRFRYRLSNLKFFNNMMNIRNPNLQG